MNSTSVNLKASAINVKKPRGKKKVEPQEKHRDLSQQSQNSFAAIDFETANRYRNSACAISIVRVENHKIVKTFTSFIKPPLLHFEFTHIHGITAKDVLNAPTFEEIYAEIIEHIAGVDFIAAHNSSFDLSVMRALCNHWKLDIPTLPWKCTVKMARTTWQLYPTKLSDVCSYLSIPLKHHDATSDATACAKIVMAAELQHQVCLKN